MKKITRSIFMIALVAFMSLGAVACGNAKSNITYCTDIVDELAAKTTAFMNEYYNKEKGTEIVVTDAKYYIKVATNVAPLESLKIGDSTFTSSQKVKVSVGNSNYANEVAFKVTESKDLIIALPILYPEAAATGKINFDIENVKGSVIVFRNETSPLTIKNVKSYGKDDANNTVVLSEEGGKQVVTQKRNNGTAYMGFNIAKNDAALSRDSVAFTKKVYSDGTATSYGMTKAENATTTECNFALYNYYKNANFTDATTLKTRDISYTLIVPTIGSIDFLIKVVESLYVA